MRKIIRRYPRRVPVRLGLKRQKQTKEKCVVHGNIKVFEISPSGKKFLVKCASNLILDDTLDWFVRCTYNTGYAGWLKIKHCAVGDDNTAVTASDETLGNEIYRTPYVLRTDSSPGSVTYDFYISGSDITTELDIKEIGIYADTSEDWAGGAGKDTGRLLTHALLSYTKATTVEMLIQYTITFAND
jgi:hypothetical protein